MGEQADWKRDREDELRFAEHDCEGCPECVAKAGTSDPNIPQQEDER